MSAIIIAWVFSKKTKKAVTKMTPFLGIKKDPKKVVFFEKPVFGDNLWD